MILLAPYALVIFGASCLPHAHAQTK